MVDLVVEELIRDLLEWIIMRERTYQEVIDAWRTSCPKLPVWEEANDRKFIAMEDRTGRFVISVTEAGSAFIEGRNRRAKVAEGAAR
jgi:hypothetical protein